MPRFIFECDVAVEEGSVYTVLTSDGRSLGAIFNWAKRGEWVGYPDDGDEPIFEGAPSMHAAAERLLQAAVNEKPATVVSDSCDQG